MLHILILILKIIGSLLAAIIGILLLAIIFVLLVPIRYQIEADGKLGEEEPLWIEIKITWLMQIISAIFSYPENTGLKIKIFGIPIFDSARKKEKSPTKSRKSTRKRRKGKDAHLIDENDQSNESNQNSENGQGKENGLDKESGQGNKNGQGNKKNQNEETSGTNGNNGNEENNKNENQTTNIESTSSETPQTNPIQKFFAALFGFFQKLLDAIRNIEYTIQELCGKIKRTMENIRYYTGILQGETFQKAFQNAKSQLLRILKMLKPRKCRVNLIIGLDDPAGTGQITAIYGMLYPLIGHHVFLQTDFEEKIVEGDLYIKGKITVIVFLIAALKLYMDKNVRKLLKILKREDT